MSEPFSDSYLGPNPGLDSDTDSEPFDLLLVRTGKNGIEEASRVTNYIQVGN